MITGAGAMLRPYQQDAVDEILAAYRNGATDVVLSAPTGSGKTFIASAVLDRMGTGIYGAASLDLQAQYLADFPMVPKIQGHSNYCYNHAAHTEPDRICPECPSGPRATPRVRSAFGVTVHLMNEHGTTFEEAERICAGAAHKVLADRARLINANPWYLFYEWMGPQWFSGRNLLVVDEADMLESVTDAVYERAIPVMTLERYGWEAPAAEALHSTVVRGLRDAYMVAMGLNARLREEAVQARKRKENVIALDIDAKAAKALIEAQLIMNITEQASATGMVAAWDDQSLTVTAVRPGDALNSIAWPNVNHRLFMSGSIADPPMWARWMGLDPATTAFVDVASTFDPSMRPIQIWSGGPRMTGRAYQDDNEVARIVEAITTYRNGRTLVHVSSAQQARILSEHLPDAITYGTGDKGGRADAITRYLSRPDTLMIAQSLRRGVDFKDDACRTNIVAKVPFPVLERKVKARKTMDNGYYIRQTVQEVIQALGRGVRGPDDWCQNYIIDGSFTGLERNFPKYMRDAVVLA